MAQFDKNSDGYLGNGHYNINGKEYMSIWTFKNKYGIEPNNSKVNDADGQELIFGGTEYFESIPDFGNSSLVYIYPLEELEYHY
jgi:hypothetical protein